MKRSRPFCRLTFSSNAGAASFCTLNHLSIAVVGLLGWLVPSCTDRGGDGMTSVGSSEQSDAAVADGGTGGTSSNGGNASAGHWGSIGGSPAMGGAAGLGGNTTAPKVPIFLAAGWGGRTVISCDNGRTWKANQEIAPEAQDDWHKPFTPKGLAYGNGTFIFLTGWGTNAIARITNDGVTWRQFPFNSYYGGIGFDSGKFVVIGGGDIQISSNNGQTWKAENTPVTLGWRESAAFDGVWASGGDGPVAVRRGTAAWMPLPSCTNMYQGGIGQSGGFAAGLGILLSVSETGNTCALNVATGADLGAGNLGVGISGKPAFTGDAFWVVSSDRIHSSVDGKTWQSKPLPQNVHFDLLARSNTGTYVGISSDGDNFFYSDNGTTWSRASGPSGNGLERLVFGMGSPSAACPAP